jgi:hypothetical protein
LEEYHPLFSPTIVVMLIKAVNFLIPREKILGPAIKLETHISVVDQFISLKKMSKCLVVGWD